VTAQLQKPAFFFAARPEIVAANAAITGQHAVARNEPLEGLGGLVIATYRNTLKYRSLSKDGRVAHIDPMGLMMVVLVGFGFAKPVMTNPRNIKAPWGGAAIAAAGPLMNLVLAILAINVLHYIASNPASTVSEQQVMFFSFMAQINLLLMLFNLIPFGQLDGHYIKISAVRVNFTCLNLESRGLPLYLAVDIRRYFTKLTADGAFGDRRQLVGNGRARNNKASYKFSWLCFGNDCERKHPTTN
jgi:hypothetical protein